MTGWRIFLGSILALCVLQLAEGDRASVLRAQETGQPPAPEPWIIEGDSLWGAREVGTEILHPRIRHGVLRVTALQGRLDPERRVLTLIDEVLIRDTVRVVQSDRGVYRRYDRILDLTGNVRGRGPEGRMEAGLLHYDRAAGTLLLRDDPELSDTLRTIWADEILYRSQTNVGIAEGDVRILLRADSTWLHARRARYDRNTGEILMTGDPWMWKPGPTPRSDLRVYADTLRMNELERQGMALGNVQIERGDVRAQSERALFELVRDRTVLYGDPRARDLDGEIHADTMVIRAVTDGPDILRAYGDVEVRYRPRERPGERNVVLGDTLRAELGGDAITDLAMSGNAVSLLLPNLQDVRQGVGRNLSRADFIRVDLLAGEARRVDLIRNASGSYIYPSDASLDLLRDPAALDSILTRVATAEDPDSLVDADFAGPGPEVIRSEESEVPEAPVEEDAREAPDDADELGVAGPPAPPPRTGPPTLPDSLDLDPLEDRPSRMVRRARGFDAAGDSTAVERIIGHFLRERNLDLPDSLLSAYDRLFDERVDYSGDTIRFYVREDVISLRGNGVLEYRGNKLESEEIDFESERDLIIALGEPALSDPTSRVVGDRMVYRTDAREGMVYQGRTEFEGGRYYGEQVKKLPDDALLVKEGRYTTCDHEPPHYHFHSDRMKLVMKDKVVARPVILKIGNVPIFALPYYFFPVDQGRRSGIMLPDVEFGFNANRGRFVRNLGYYWAISDYMDTRMWMDYIDRGPIYRFNGDLRYKVRYLLNGDVSGSWADERDAQGDKTIRWHLNGTHNHDLWEDGNLTATLRFQSDRDFFSDFDFGAGVDERLNRQLRSTVNFQQRWSTSSLAIAAHRVQHLDETTGGGIEVDSRIPSIDYRLNSFPIGAPADERGSGGRLPFLSTTYVALSSAFRAERITRFGADEDTTGTIENTSDEAARVNWSVTDNRRLGDYLKLSPSVSGTAAWFSEDARGESSQAGATWNAGMRASTILYGTFGAGVGPVEAVRHVVEPSVSYSYRPELESLTYTDSLGVTRSRFPSVGGISLGSSESSSMSFALSQRFHVKWRRGEEVIKKENLISWDASAGYNFLIEDPGEKLSNISNSIRFRPFQTFDAGARMEIDPHDWVRRSYSVDANVRLSSRLFARDPRDTTAVEQDLQYGEFGDSDLSGTNIGNREAEETEAPPIPWDLSLSYRLTGARGSTFKTHALGVRATVTPTTAWRVSGGLSYDLEDDEVVSHNFELNRDLHCWQLSFGYRSGGSYVFRISIKDIPEVKYETER